MIYDHGLVDGWRTRIQSEELAARDSLRKFIGQRKGVQRPASAANNLRYQDRNGPWGNGGNFSEARHDQPYSDMQEKRLKENISVWDSGFRPPASKAVSPAKQTAMMKEKKKMEDELAKAERGEKEEALISARTNLSLPDEALLRISPLTDIVPEPHVKGIRRSWGSLENDPVKIQLRQEDLVHTKGTLENRTMLRLSPLMKMRPKTANPRPISSRNHFRNTEEGYGHIGEDGARGDVRMGWIAQNMIPTQDYLQPLSTRRSQSSLGSRGSSKGSGGGWRGNSRPSTGKSRASSAGTGRRRRDLENLIRRVHNLEGEIDDVRVAREEVEGELEMTRASLSVTQKGLPPRLPK